MTKMEYYILLDKKPVAVDFKTFGNWMVKQKAHLIDGYHSGEMRVGLTKIGKTTISTVFLGIDHNFSRDGPPVLFETMVFGGLWDLEQKRYCTWEEAEAGHKAMVKRVKEFSNV